MDYYVVIWIINLKQIRACQGDEKIEHCQRANVWCDNIFLTVQTDRQTDKYTYC